MQYLTLKGKNKRDKPREKKEKKRKRKREELERPQTWVGWSEEMEHIVVIWERKEREGEKKRRNLRIN